MRTGIWVFAICGVAGLITSIGFAQDRAFDFDRFEFEEAKSRPSVRYFSRNGQTGVQEAPVRPTEVARPTEAASESETAEPSHPIRKRRPLPSRYVRRSSQEQQTSSAIGGTPATRNLKNYGQQLFGDAYGNQTVTHGQPSQPLAPSQQAGHDPLADRIARMRQVSAQSAQDRQEDLIHADYEHANSRARGDLVRQVEGTEPLQTAQTEFPQTDFSNAGFPESTEPLPAESLPSEPLPTEPLPAGPLPAGLNGFGDENQDIINQPPRSEDPALGSGLNANAEVAVGPQTPSISLEWVKRSDVNVGQECLCDLVVKNSGKTAAKDVAIDAYFPKSVRITNAVPQPIDVSDHLSWDVTELAPGEERVISITLVPSKRGGLTTKAFVRFTGSASGLFDVEEPMLQISVKGPTEVMVGDIASQTVVVTNPGSGIASNVTVEAAVPKGLEHPRGERLVMEIGALNPGETRMVRLALAAVSGGQQTLNVIARADADLKQTVAADISVISPSVSVEVDGPSLRYIGRVARYVIRVTNDGGASSNNVRVLHHLPKGFKFVRADNGGKHDSTTNSVGWFVGRLDQGQTADLNIELLALQPGVFQQTVSAVSEHGARSEATVETQVEGTASLVLEIIDLDDPVEVGTETAYEVRVRNEGSKAAQNVGVSCELPASVQMISAKGPVDHVSENGLVVFKSLNLLAPGKTAVYRIHVRGQADGNYRFRARLASDSIREPLIFEELTKFYGE